MSRRKIFYVYGLFRPDPDGSICYIGKGKEDRWRVSARTLRRENRLLTQLIKEAGGELPAAIIRDKLTEKQAFRYEIELIASIGRKPHGPLLNLTDGGDGGPGFVDVHWTIETHPEVAERIRTKIAAYWSRRRALGLSLTNRGASGNLKHSKKMREYHDRRRRSGPLPRLPKNSLIVTFNKQPMNLSYAAKMTGMSYRRLRYLIHTYKFKPQAAFDLCLNVKRKLMVD